MALLSVAASCFVMIIAQSAATSRVFALRHHERVDADLDISRVGNRECGCRRERYSSWSTAARRQTAMADSAGARSQIAQLVFAGVVLLVLLVMTGPLQYLPRCVLAGIVCASSFVPILSRDEIPHWHYRLALGYKPVRPNLVFGSDSHQDGVVTLLKNGCVAGGSVCRAWDCVRAVGEAEVRTCTAISCRC